MPSVYSSPGAYPKETDLSQIVSGISNSIGAMVGAASRGPVKCRVLVTDIKQLIETFGEPNATVSFMHYSALAFLTWAKRLYVTRVVGTGALHANLILTGSNPGYTGASAGTSPIAPKKNPSYSFNGGDCFLVYATGPGVYANSEISVRVTNVVTSTTPHTFNLEVYQTVSGVKSKVETFIVSKGKGLDGFGRQLYLEDVINEKSKFIRVLDNTAVTTDPFAMSSDQLLTQGADGSAPNSGDIEGTNGWQLYANPDDVKVGILMPGGLAIASTDLVMNTIAQTRRDCIAISVVPSQSQDGSAELTYRNSTWNINSSFSALYTPDVLIHDPYSNVNLYVPPDGYVGAVYAKTEQLRQAWEAPAGFDMGILNVLGVRLNYTQGQRDALYEAQINTIRTFPGQGTMIWGQKTAQSKTSALSSVNVRRLIIVTENSIRESLVKVVFKLNNKFTRLQVFQMIDQFLRTVKAQNGVYDYKIVCDETNNTPQIIDQNQMNVDVYMKPQRSAEVIQLQTIITRTGASFNELVNTGGNL